MKTTAVTANRSQWQELAAIDCSHQTANLVVEEQQIFKLEHIRRRGSDTNDTETAVMCIAQAYLPLYVSHKRQMQSPQKCCISADPVLSRPLGRSYGCCLSSDVCSTGLVGVADHGLACGCMRVRRTLIIGGVSKALCIGQIYHYSCTGIVALRDLPADHGRVAAARSPDTGRFVLDASQELNFSLEQSSCLTASLRCPARAACKHGSQFASVSW